MADLLHAESRADDTVIITISGVVAYQSPDQITGAVRAAIVRWAARSVLLEIADVSLLVAGRMWAVVASLRTGAWAGVEVRLLNVGTLPAGQLRETGLAALLCPDLPAPDGGVAVALYAPASPLSERTTADCPA